MIDFLFALIPIFWIIMGLVVLKKPGTLVISSALIVTVVIAILKFGMTPINAGSAALEGGVMGLWPIVYVIIAAVFTYNITTASGSMEKIREALTAVTSDHRLLVLVIVWGLGVFLEGIAGFGTSVAIPASILIAFGIDPIKAATVALIANTTPTAFGALGLPITTLAQISGLDTMHISSTVPLQLLLLNVLIPFILVMVIDGHGFKSLKNVWWVALGAGLSYAIPQYAVAHYLGPEMPDMIGAATTLLVTIVLARIYMKKFGEKENKPAPYTKKELTIASLPFILVFLLVVMTSEIFPTINKAVSSISTSVVLYTGANAVPYKLVWIATPGTLILIASIIGTLLQGFPFGKTMNVLWKTIKQMAPTFITVMSIVALAKVMSYSGMVTQIAITLIAVFGIFYPIISPAIGALGTFITGSDTSANVLFGQLQRQAAEGIGVDPYWLAAANMAGATIGKMISPQSIAVATAATNMSGKEGALLKSVFKYFGIYMLVLTVWVLASGFLLGSLHF